jgi:hypothetical protein
MKKLPIVKCREGASKDIANYGFTNFNMAWVSNPSLGRQQATAILKCREFLCSCVQAQFCKNNYGGYFAINKDAPIDIDRTRLLILNDGSEDLNKQQFKQNLFHGKVLLNIYEKVGNFSSLSKISTINHERYEKQWLITGPKEWMKAGQLISAMTFLLRLATFGNLIDTSNLTTVETSFRKIIDSKIKPVRYATDVDQNLECFWDKMWILVKFQNELFSNDYKKNYSSELDNDDFGMRCGIQNLAAGSSGLPGKIDEKFIELCKKYLPRKGDIR